MALEQHWFASESSPEEVVQAAQMLKEEGAFDFTRREVIRLTVQASNALQKANPQGEAGIALAELVNKLLVRKS